MAAIESSAVWGNFGMSLSKPCCTIVWIVVKKIMVVPTKRIVGAVSLMLSEKGAEYKGVL